MRTQVLKPLFCRELLVVASDMLRVIVDEIAKFLCLAVPILHLVNTPCLFIAGATFNFIITIICSSLRIYNIFLFYMRYFTDSSCPFTTTAPAAGSGVARQRIQHDGEFNS